MENSYLNMAHSHGRKAEKLCRQHRYDEAVSHHDKAIANLSEALKNCTSSKAQESINLQRNYHRRQIDLALLKKAHFEKCNKQTHVELTEEKDGIFNTYDIQMEIFKTLEDSDLQLNAIENWEISHRLENQYKEKISTVRKSIEYENTIENSTPVGDLRKLNHKLHSLVYRLISKLDEVVQENQELRFRNKAIQQETTTNMIHGDTLGETESIDILSEGIVDLGGSSDQSPEVLEAKEFPSLAPLELPKFDIDSFDSKSIDN